MRDVVLVSAVRTAIGDYGGMFKDVSACDLGIVAVRAALQKAGIGPDEPEDVIVGNCMMRPDEINIARVISLRAGIPETVPAVTIQRQCASSMQALVFAAQKIWCGEAECVLVAGVEAMSNVPYVLYDMRWGKRMRHAQVIDGLWQGLEDPIHHIMMGITAENLAEKYGITRAEQDELALTSHQRAAAAQKSGRFEGEIVPVELPQRGKPPKVCVVDEHPRADLTLADLSKAKPAFKDGGTVTAGNASAINDAAAAAVLMSGERAAALGLKPLARIVSHAVAGVDPLLMGWGPVPASEKALQRAGLALSDIGLVELNEAFAAQYIACERGLGLDRAITNVNGSGIGLGHPVGATGLRIVGALAHEMQRRSVRYGLATLCVGGGMGKAVILERL